MLIIKRYLPHFSGILTLIFLEIFINYPKLLPYVAGLYFVLLVACLWYLQRGKLKNRSQQIAYFALPIILISNWVSFVIYFTFGKFILHTLALVAGIIIWLYLESFFLKHYFIGFYKQHSFENLVGNLIIITMFLSSVNFFSLKVYIGWPYYALFIIFGIILLILTWIALVNSNFLAKKSSLIYVGVVALLSLEIMAISIFLPTNFYSIALINTLFFYILITFSKSYLDGRFSIQMARKYLSVSAIILFIVLFVSNWT